MLNEIQRAARLKGAHTNHEKKLARISQADADGRELLRVLTEKEFLVAGACLYWGEGAKTDKLSFINSDRVMLLFMKHWFETCLEVAPEDFIARVCINHVHAPRIDVVEGYWSEWLSIPREQFRSASYTKTDLKKKYANHDCYYGQLCLRIRRSSGLKYRILGLINGLKNSKLPTLPA